MTDMLSLLQPAIYHFIGPATLVLLIAYLLATSSRVGLRLRAVTSR